MISFRPPNYFIKGRYGIYMEPQINETHQRIDSYLDGLKIEVG